MSHLQAKAFNDAPILPDFTIDALDKRLLLATYPVTSYLLGPLESLVGGADTTVTAGTGGQSDTYEFETFYDGKVSLGVRPLDPSMQLRVSYDGVVETGATGEPVILRNVARPAGPESVDVEVLAGSGDYLIDFAANADWELENFGGPGNDTLPAAQALDGSAIALGSGERLAVRGSTSSGAVDLFKFAVAANEPVSVAISGVAEFEILDPSGTVIVDGADGGKTTTNFVKHFESTVAGDYFVRVTGQSAGTYNLVATRGLSFDAGGVQDLLPGVDLLGFGGDSNDGGTIIEQEYNNDIPNANDANSNRTAIVVQGFIDAFYGDTDIFDLGYFEVGDVLEIDLDLVSGFGDSVLRLFDEYGNELAYSDDDSAPGETDDSDRASYIYFDGGFVGGANLNGAENGGFEGRLYLGVSEYSTDYDPFGETYNYDAYADSFDYDLYIGFNGADPDTAGGDVYGLYVTAGETITLSATDNTPFFIDLAIDLFDEAGNLVATADDTNGTDPQLSFTVPNGTPAGSRYTAVVRTVSGFGGFLVSADHSIVAGPIVTSATYVDPYATYELDNLPSFPEQVDVVLSDAIRLESLDLTDLQIIAPDGTPLSANSLTRVSGNRFIFDIVGIAQGPGVYELRIESGDILGASGLPLAATYSQTFNFTDAAPRVIDSSIMPGDTVPAGQFVYRATFNKELRQIVSAGFFGYVVLDDSDVTLIDSITGQSVQGSLSYNAPDGADPYIDWSVANLNEGIYELRLLADDLPDPDGFLGGFEDEHIQSLDGIALDGSPSFALPSGDGHAGDDFVVNFIVERDGVSPMPALEAVEPLRSGIYSSQISGAITTSLDVDTFSLTVPQDAPIALTLTHMGGVGRFQVVVRDASGAVVSTTSATAAGGDVVVPVDRFDAGDIQIEVTSLDGGLGAYRIDATYGATNADAGATAGTALDLGPTLITYGNGSGRFGAIGTVSTTSLTEVRATTPPFTLHEPQVIEFPAGDVPTGDVVYEFQSNGGTASSQNIFVSIEGLKTGEFRASGSFALGRSVVLTPTQWQQAAADGVVRVSIRPGIFVSTGNTTVTVTERKPVANDADLYRVPVMAGEETSFFIDSSENKSVYACFEDAAGNVLSFDRAGSDFSGQPYGRLGNYRADADGEVFIRVVGNGAYNLAVGKNATVGADLYSPATLLGPSNRAIDDLRAFSSYVEYRFFARAGDALTIETGTPFMPEGNSLNPALTVYRPSGGSLGSNADGGDGVNALLNVVATETGLHRIRVNRTSGGGLLTVSVNGASPDDVAPSVASTFPANQGESAALSNVLVTFNEPIMAGSMDPAAFAADNGVSATDVVLVDAYTVMFVLTGPAGAGVYNYTIAPGVVTDFAGNGNGEIAGNFEVDVTGPRFLEPTPGQAAAPFTDAQFIFDDAIDPASVTKDDLIALTGPGGENLLSAVNTVSVVNGRIAVNIDPQTANGNYTFTFRPTFLNLAGIAADEDGDGTPGELGDDVIVATVVLANPDLAVITADAPPTITMTQPFTVNYTVENVGTDPATAGWADRILISTSPTFDSSAQSIFFTRPDDALPLADGETYDRSAQITLGLLTSRPPGTYYLYVVTDTLGNIVEANEADNVFRIGPVTLQAPALPNLVASDVTAPASASSGQDVNVSWTLTNSGTDDFTGTFFERISLSGDNAIGSDRFIKDVPFTGTLLAGQSITRTASITVPFDAEGQQWAVVWTDRFDAVEEYLNENDNLAISATPMNVTLAPQVDLVPVNLQGPSTAQSSQTIAVTWTVQNNGTADFNGTFSDRLYLSADNAIGGDQFVRDYSFTGTIPAGGSIQRTVDLTLPFDLGDDRYLVVRTDIFNQVQEVGGETNNDTISASPIDISLAPQPDLVVSDVDGPDSVFSGATTTVSWVVTNQGTADSNANIWYDYVYLSVDDEINTGDRYLGRVRNAAFLRPGESYANQLDVTIPLEFAGNYHFVVRTDGLNNVREVGGENNNDAASQTVNVQLTPPPDLRVGFSNSPNNVFSGQRVLVNFRVDNNGETPSGGFSNDIWLSTDETLGGDIRLTSFTSIGIAANGSLLYEQFVNIPVGISGDYFFIFETDSRGNVFEGPFENNNTRSEAVTVLLTPPPDLVVTPISVPSSLVSGKSSSATFRVDNLGSTTTDRGSWTDAVYLSTDNVLDASDQRIGTRNHNGFLQPGEGYETTVNFSVPVDASGPRYLLLRTDYQTLVFELDRDNNVSPAAVTIDAQLPDLRISAATMPTDVVTGTAIPFDFTVINEGIGDTRTGIWYDRVYLSTDEQINSGDLLLGQVQRDGLLNPGETYDVSRFFSIPQGTLPGEYFFLLATDYTDRVFEGADEADNVISRAVTVTENLPNLVVTGITPPAPALSGGPLTVTWTTQNQGGGATQTNYWEETVYLSTDGILDNSDQQLGVFRNYDILASGESYVGSLTFTPQVPGDYFLIVRTDSYGRVPEGVAGEVDNITAQPFTIEPGPSPDLIVTDVTAADTGFSGRDIDLSYTVRNDGTQTIGRNFYNTIYLSADTTYDSGDRSLGSQLMGELEAGVDRTVNTTVRLPAGLTGNWYLVVRTDSGNYIYERNGELNNAAADIDGIQIDLAPPVDLVAGLIPLPVDAFAGQTASISYSVANAGPADIVGTWTDSIYISADPVWDISDPLFAEVRVEGPVANGESYTRTVSAPLPGLPTGDYHVIVRSDILNFVIETSEDNNASATLGAFEITVPQLTLDVPEDTTVLGGRFVYYRVDVDADQTLLVDLDARSGFGATELYVRYGQVATRNNFDFAYDKPLQRDQRVIVPNTQAGTYYITAFVSATTFAPSADLTITARQVPFSLLETDLGLGGNSGLRTIELKGARFDRTVTATLVAGGTEIPAIGYHRIDDATLFATFDLRGAAVGEYGLRLDKPSTGETDVTLDAFTVVNSVSLEPVSFNGVTPGAARPLSPTPLNMTWGNNSLNDAYAPVLQMVDEGVGYGFGGMSRTRPTMTFVGLADNEPRGILLPGSASSINLTSPGGFGDGNHEVSGYVLSEDPNGQVDFELVRASLRELQPTWQQDRFDEAFARMVQDIGTDWGSVLAAVSVSANRLTSNPQIVFLQELLEVNLIEAYAATGTSINGAVTAVSFRVDIADRIVIADNLDTGERFLAQTYRDGTFQILDATEGRYRLSVEDGLLLETVELQLWADSQAINVQIPLQRSSEIRGTVLDDELDPVQPDVWLLDGPGGQRRGDADGTFAFGGLAAGTYQVLVEADGMARRMVNVAVGPDGDIARPNIVLSEQAIVRGSVTVGGQPLGTAELLASIAIDGEPSHLGSIGGDTFLIEHLPAGTYELTLKAVGSLATTVEVTVNAGDDIDLGVIDLTPAASIAGSVVFVDLPNIASVRVDLLADGEVFATQVAEDGSTLFFGDLPAGDYQLRVVDSNGVAGPVDVTLAIGQELTGTTLEVFPGGKTRGTITANGSPVAGIRVVATDVANARTFSAVSGADGAYNITALPIGDYSIATDVGTDVPVGINIPSLNAVRSVDLNIAPSAKVGGVLTGTGGVPRGAASVTLALDGKVIAESTTNDAGRWSFLIFAAGTYELAAGAITQTVSIGVGDDLNIDLANGNSSVSVGFAASIDTQNRRVMLSRVNGTQITPISSQFLIGPGTATFTGIAPGEYQVDTFYVDGRRDTQRLTAVAGNNAVEADVASDVSVTGEVVDGTGAPIVFGYITLLDTATGVQVATGYIRSDGTFSIEAADGVYDVVVAAELVGVARFDDIAFGGGATPALILTQTDEHVVGRAVINGAPVNAGEVFVRDSAGVVVGMGRIKPDGTFNVTTADVSGTNLTLVVQRDGHAPAEQATTLVIDGTVDVGDIALTPVAVGLALPDAGGALRIFNETLNSILAQLPLVTRVSRAALGMPTLDVTTYGDRFRFPTEAEILEDCPGCLDELVALRTLIEAEQILAEKARAAVSDYDRAALDALLTFTARTAKLTGALTAMAAAILPLATAAAGTSFLATVIPGTAQLGTVGTGVANAMAATGILDALVGMGQAVLGFANPVSTPGEKANQINVADGTFNFLKGAFDTAYNALSLAVTDFADDFAGGGVRSAVIGGLYELGQEFFNNKLRTDMADALVYAERVKNTAEASIRQVAQMKPRIDKAWQAFTLCKIYGCEEEPDWDRIDRDRRWLERLRRIASQDPNDILGPDGYGDSRFVTAEETLGYRVRFENEASATAPAQFIRITHPLDAALDFRTFRLGDMAFADVTVDVPDNVPFFQTRLDLTETKGFLVEITAGIDIVSGEAFWEFETIDPVTGQRSADPTIGLLPINDGTGIGEGFVDYTIRARADVPTGTTISAEADIIFDLNAPLLTPIWTNTIDNDRPTSVATAPTNSATPTFDVSWQGTDPDGGSGLATYSVFVSIDGGPYQPWLLGTELTSAPFQGTAGRTYSFITVARDNAGNRETIPTSADAIVQVEGASVVGRHLFYNDSAFDGDAGPSANDDLAIAADKSALLPGGIATFGNYSSYTRGLNGVMIDIAGLPDGTLTAADFGFVMGNNNAPDTWVAAPSPTSITVRRGAGVDGSDRVTLIWDNGVISKTWLQITVRPTANTGLSSADVFYFGNAPGESGNSSTDAVVNTADVILTRNNQSGFSSVGIDNLFDYDRDGDVDLSDVIHARNNLSGFTPLRLIDLTGGTGGLRGGDRPTFGAVPIRLGDDGLDGLGKLASGRAGR